MSEETKQTQDQASNTAGNDDRRSGGRAMPMDDRMTGEARPRGKRRRKVSYLTINKIEKVDFRDVATLRRFTNDRGKILSSKVSGNTASQQRMIASAIRKAREMALMPFVVTEFSGDQRPMRPRGPRYSDHRSEDMANRDSGPRAPREAAPAKPEAPAEAAE